MNETKKRVHDPIAISASEAAELLGVSKPTVYQFMRMSDFPAVKIGGRRLISFAGLQLWMERRTEGARAGE